MTENKGSEASGDDGAPEQNKTEQKRIAVTIGIGFLFAPISVGLRPRYRSNRTMPPRPCS